MSTKSKARAAFSAADMTDTVLIRAAIEATPDPRPGNKGDTIPATYFAETIALCNPRTVRRYLAGERPLTPLLRAKCVEIVEAAEAKRWRVAGREARKSTGRRRATVGA